MSLSGRRKSYKILLLGDPAVGKTSLRKRFMGEGFKAGNYMPTLGADFSVKRFERNVMQVWDLAGQMVYKSIRDQFYKGASGILLLFDIKNPVTFSHLTNWIDEAITSLKYQIPLYLIGNKSDLRDGKSDEINSEQVHEYITKLTDWYKFDVKFFETSAMTGKNIDLVFSEIVKEIDEWLHQS